MREQSEFLRFACLNGCNFFNLILELLRFRCSFWVLWLFLLPLEHIKTTLPSVHKMWCSPPWKIMKPTLPHFKILSLFMCRPFSFDSLLLRIYQNNTECGVQRKPLQHNITRIKNQLQYKFTDKHNFVVQTVLLIRVQCCKDLLHKRGNSALAQQQQTTHSLLSCCCLQNPKCSYCSHQSTNSASVCVLCYFVLGKKRKNL